MPPVVEEPEKIKGRWDGSTKDFLYRRGNQEKNRLVVSVLPFERCTIIIV